MERIMLQLVIRASFFRDKGCQLCKSQGCGCRNVRTYE